jgi:hypothetical protein
MQAVTGRRTRATSTAAIDGRPTAGVDALGADRLGERVLPASRSSTTSAYCARDGATCRWEGRTRTLRASYQQRFQPVVEERLEQAGVRLAKLLAARAALSASRDDAGLLPASDVVPGAAELEQHVLGLRARSCAPRFTAGGAPPNCTGFAQTRTDVPSGAGESTR